MHGTVTFAAATPGTLWRAWTPDALVLLLALIATAAYARGVLRLWRSAGDGQIVTRWRAGAFGAGVAGTLVALASPLEPLAEALFSAHMVQHLLLALVAPPLILLGRPGVALVHGVSDSRRRRIGRWQGRLRRGAWRVPGVAVAGPALYVAVLLGWHLPGSYDAAVADPLIHELEHATLLGAGAAFWWPIVEPRRIPAWTAPLSLLVAATAGGLLSVLLTFADHAWYAAHTASAPPWGLTPLQDQQLAGAIMWVPGGIIYLLAAALAFVRWLHEDERTTRRRQAPPGAVEPVRSRDPRPGGAS